MSVSDPEKERGQGFWRLVKPPDSYGVNDIPEIHALFREWPTDNGYHQHQDRHIALYNRLKELEFSDPNSREARTFWSTVKSPNSYSSEDDAIALGALLREWPKDNGRPRNPQQFIALLNRLQLLRHTVAHPQPPSRFQRWFHGAPPTPQALPRRDPGNKAQKEQERLVGLINQRAAAMQKGTQTTLSDGLDSVDIAHELQLSLYTRKQIEANFLRMRHYFQQNVRGVQRITDSTCDNHGCFSISFLQGDGSTLILRAQQAGRAHDPDYLITLTKV